MPNPKYKANKKNGGNVPKMPDNRVSVVPVGCGKCIECRKQRRMGWIARLMFEHRTNDRKGYFVTFTFSNSALVKLRDKVMDDIGGEDIHYYDLVNLQAGEAVKLWRENIRRFYNYHGLKEEKPKYWLCTELTPDKGRLHIHGFVWTTNSVPFKKWQSVFGFTKENRITEARIKYATKYMMKTVPRHKMYKPKIFCSNGLGAGYEETYNGHKNKFNGEDTLDFYRTETGHKIPLPQYYRNKIYSDEEREKLWLYRLDKQERWVLGKRIDVSNGHEVYDKAVKEARVVNRDLGYMGGDDFEEDWYKRQLRSLQR